MLHLAAAYEWVLQGCPRRPPGVARVRAVGSQLRQAEFRQAPGYQRNSSLPSCLGEFEIASSPHDALSARHDRGFEDLDLFFGPTFRDPTIPLVILELGIDNIRQHSRAFVFSDSLSVSVDKAMVLGVRNGHTRMLMPSAETPPAVWAKWDKVVDSVVRKSWGGWPSMTIMDRTQCNVTLAPCTICSRLVRLPQQGGLHAGTTDNWWGRWNPCSHFADVSVDQQDSNWNYRPVQSNDEGSIYAGRGTLSSEAALSIGMPFLPDCDHQWRRTGPILSEAVGYSRNLPEQFDLVALRALANEGDALAQQCGGIYPTLFDLQESEVRDQSSQLTFAHENRTLPPAQYPAVIGILSQGVLATYSRGCPYLLGLEGCRITRIPLWRSPRSCGRTSEHGGFSRAQHCTST